MGKLWPFVGLAVAISVGVTFAPVIGALAAALLAAVLLYSAVRVIRPMSPLLARVTFVAGAVIGGVAVAHDWHSPLAQWAELIYGVAVIAVAWSWARPWYQRAAARAWRYLNEMGGHLD